MAATTLERPATEPTLRSISADAITKVIATAITEIVAVCLKMFRRLLAVRKPLSLSVTENSRNSAAKPK